MVVVAYPDKDARDRAFQDLRHGNHLERQAVKFSEFEVLLNPEVAGEILLDAKGQHRCRTVYCVAYPDR